MVPCSFLAPGAVHFLAFKAGARIRIGVYQEGTDLTLRLIDPLGREMLVVDSPNDDMGKESIAAVAPLAGTYALEIRGGNDSRARRYRLRLAEPVIAGARDQALAKAAHLLDQARRLLKTAREQDEPAAAVAQLEAAREGLAVAQEMWRDTGDDEAAAIGRLVAATLARELTERRVDPAVKRAEAAGERRMLELALELYRRLGNVPEQARAWFMLAQADRRRGAWPMARAACREALALVRPEQDPELAARAHNDLGVIEGELGDAQEAVRNYFAAADLWVAHGSRARAAESLMNLGQDLLRQGRLEAARALLERARRFIGPATRSLGEGDPKGRDRRFVLAARFGQLSHAEGDLAAALGHFRAALAEEAPSDHLRSQVQNAIGNTLLDQGQLKQASRAYQRARDGYRAASRPVDVAIVGLNLGRLDLLRGKVKAASFRFENALAVFQQEKHVQGQASAYRGLSLATRDLGDLDGARQLAEAAVARVESIRESTASTAFRTSFLNRKRPYYETLVAILFDLAKRPGVQETRRQAYLDRALEVAEMQHARRLLDQLGTRERQAPEPPAALAATEIELLAALEHARTRRRHGGKASVSSVLETGLRTRLDVVQAALRSAAAAAGAVIDGSLASAAVIRESLGTDTTLLEVVGAEDRVLLFRVESDRIEALDLGSRQGLEDLARAVHGQIVASGAERLLQPLLRTLSQRLLAPLGERIGKRRLAVVADGALGSVPWTVLLAAGGRPLVADHEVVRLPSVSALLMVRARQAARPLATRSIAIVADGVFDTADDRLPLGRWSDPGPPVLERLPASAAEAMALADLYAADDPLVARGFDAKASLLTDGVLRPFRILHLAIHGAVARSAIDRPSLIFSRFDRAGALVADPILSTDEIARLRLDAELVVLSACSTARRSALSGDGISSMALATFHAGAARLVSSLWDVGDQATASLMIAFHRALVRGVAPGEALRQVQDVLRRAGASTADWAGFVFSGEWRPMP